MNDELLEDLDAYVGAAEEAPPTAMDDDLANRLLRRLRRQQRRRAEVLDVANAERLRIAAWAEGQLEIIDSELAQLERTLDGYMRAVQERRGLKTLKLPNGELKLRAPRLSVTVTDEPALVDWAIERVAADLAQSDDIPAARIGVRVVIAALADEPTLKVVVEPARGGIGKATEPGPVLSSHEDVELLAAVTADGETVPGVQIERSTRDTFKATPSGLELVHDVTEQDPTQGGTDEQ